MGLPSTILFTLLLLKSSLCFVDDVVVEDLQDVLGPSEDLELEPYLERPLRSDAKYLRFGRAPWAYENDLEPLYDPKQSSRPSRIGSFSGNPQQRTHRDQSAFLRFGRSVGEGGKKKRDKREVSASDALFKRHENFLRFGRTANSNFMRFGRNMTPRNPIMMDETDLLNYLKSLLLLRQSEENVRQNKSN